MGNINQEKNLFTSLPTEIQLKIWRTLGLDDQIMLCKAHHSKSKCPMTECKGHLCQLNPISKLITLSTPPDKPPLACPYCQILVLFKEFGGDCPEGSNPNNPYQYYIRQPKKVPMLFAANNITGDLR